MRERTSKVHIHSLLALLLFAVFAVGVLSVLTTGAGVYRRLVERDDSAYTGRTAERYLSAKVRQAPAGGAVSLEELDGCQALTIREELAGEVYLTQIYCHDGHLRELFHMEGSGLGAGDGEIILPMAALEGDEENGLLRVRVTGTDGEERELFFALAGGEEGLE